MATYGSVVRRGLPRRPGGNPWPAAGDAPVEVPAAAATGPEAVRSSQMAGAEAAGSPSVTTEAAGATGAAPARVRRGLPRVAGGEPWPPVSFVATGIGAPTPTTATLPEAASLVVGTAAEAATPSVVAMPTMSSGAGPEQKALTVRRGLPRTAGGESWPPETFVARLAAHPTAVSTAAQLDPTTDVATPSVSPSAGVAVAVGPPAPLTVPRTVWVGEAAFTRPVPKPEPTRIGPFTKGQWAGVVVVGGFGLLFAAAMAVLFVRWLLSLEFMQDFLFTYPGEYHLPEGAPVGFPGWLGWQHFFNVFLMVLIIRSGLQVRQQAKPPAFWSPKWNRARKISINLWFHQSLDILWLVNGVIFVVLLFVTGQWMRIVPTSWEVFPNALSAALQYVSLDWPTENGWVNYNSLQQLAYFTTVFIAAPLAAITGYRMSGLWPKSNQKLNDAYPVEWARAVHFPVMLYFCVFIFVHVALVVATGALRNLNHMYGAQDAVNWTGFWIFAASLLVIAAAWAAARPLVLAPIAKLFGAVTER